MGEPETDDAFTPSPEAQPDDGGEATAHGRGSGLDIRTKLLGSFALLILLIVLVGVIVQVQSHRVQSGLRDLYDNDLTGMGKITFVARDSARPTTRRRCDCSTETDPQLRDQLHKEIVGYDQEVGSLLQKIDADPTSAFTRASSGSRPHTASTSRSATRSSPERRGRQADAEAMVGDQLRTQAIDVTKSLDRLAATNLAGARATNNDILAGMRVNRMVLLIVAGLGMILAFLVVWVVSTHISDRLRSLARAADALAKGDFSRRRRRVPRRGRRARRGVQRDGGSARATRQRGTHRQPRDAGVDRRAGDLRSARGSGDLTVRLAPSGDAQLDALGGNLNRMVESLGDMSRQVSEATSSMGAATSEILAAVSQHTASAASSPRRSRRRPSPWKRCVPPPSRRPGAHRKSPRRPRPARRSPTRARPRSSGSSAA